MITSSLEKPPKILQSEHSASGGVLYLKSEIDNCFCARCSQIYRLINNPIKAERLNSTQDDRLLCQKKTEKYTLTISLKKISFTLKVCQILIGVLKISSLLLKILSDAFEFLAS